MGRRWASSRCLLGLAFFAVLLCQLKTSLAASGACPTSGGASVLVTTTNGWMTVSASGCPEWDPTQQKTPNTPSYQNYNVRIPVKPILSSSPIYVGRTLDSSGTINSQPVMGMIGITINGISIYSDTDADKRDAWVYEGPSMDRCRGHADGRGSYHLHTGSECVYSNPSGAHSTLLGVMIDGIPIFGPNGDKGQVPTDLDNCRGHTDNTHPYYHYHVTTDLSAPYTIRCLKGCIQDAWGSRALLSYVGKCTPDSTQYSYDALKINWYSGGSNSASTSPNPPSNSASPSPGSGSGCNAAAPSPRGGTPSLSPGKRSPMLRQTSGPSPRTAQGTTGCPPSGIQGQATQNTSRATNSPAKPSPAQNRSPAGGAGGQQAGGTSTMGGRTGPQPGVNAGPAGGPAGGQQMGNGGTMSGTGGGTGQGTMNTGLPSGAGGAGGAGGPGGQQQGGGVRPPGGGPGGAGGPGGQQQGGGMRPPGDAGAGGGGGPRGGRRAARLVL